MRHLSYIVLLGIAGCATASFAPDPASPARAGKVVAVELAGGTVALGSAGVIELVPSHCDTTVNLHDVYWVVRDGRLEDVWPIAARGRIR